MRILEIHDDYEIEHCQTLEDAIACALEDAEPGCVITIHDSECDGGTDGTKCTCEPMVIVAGAKA